MDIESNLHVLIVDNDHSAKLTAHAVNRCKVRICYSIKDALEEYKKEEPDIIFSEVELKDGSGFELLDKLKEFNPNILLVYLTKSSKQQDVINAQVHGAYGYVVKPFKTNRIRHYIDELVMMNKNLMDASYSDIELKKAENMTRARDDIK